MKPQHPNQTSSSRDCRSSSRSHLCDNDLAIAIERHFLWLQKGIFSPHTNTQLYQLQDPESQDGHYFRGAWEQISAECNPCLGLPRGCFPGEQRCDSCYSLASLFLCCLTLSGRNRVLCKCSRVNNKHDRRYIKSLVDFNTDQLKKEHIDGSPSRSGFCLSLD